MPTGHHSTSLPHFTSRDQYHQMIPKIVFFLVHYLSDRQLSSEIYFGIQ